MNPQHIVYLGLVLVALGVSVSAIDQLKPSQDEYGLYKNDYYSKPVFIEAGADYKIEMIADNVYRMTVYPEADWKPVPEFNQRNSIEWDTDVKIPDSATITDVRCLDGGLRC